MSEDMTFLPKPTFSRSKRLDRLCSTFIAKGVRKCGLRRRTAGAARHHDARARWRAISDQAPFDELTLTTTAPSSENTQRSRGSRGAAHQRLARHPRRGEFRAVTRWGGPRQGSRRHQGRARRRPRHQDQRRGPQGRETRRIRTLIAGRMARGWTDVHRSHAVSDVGEGRLDSICRSPWCEPGCRHFTWTDRLPNRGSGPLCAVAETCGRLGFIRR